MQKITSNLKASQKSKWMLRVAILVGVGAVMLPALAQAHPGHSHSDLGFVAGLLHPLTGFDHLLALLGIGLWSQQQKGAARVWMPVSFAAAILGGAGLAGLGVALPGMELGIAASVLIVGLLVASARALPLGWAVSLGALFAVFHGYAHIAELSATAALASYVVGFMTMSLLGMAGGVVLARLFERASSRGYFARATGVGIAIAGAFFAMAA